MFLTVMFNINDLKHILIRMFVYIFLMFHSDIKTIYKHKYLKFHPPSLEWTVGYQS